MKRLLLCASSLFVPAAAASQIYDWSLTAEVDSLQGPAYDGEEHFYGFAHSNIFGPLSLNIVSPIQPAAGAVLSLGFVPNIDRAITFSAASAAQAGGDLGAAFARTEFIVHFQLTETRLYDLSTAGSASDAVVHFSLSRGGATVFDQTQPEGHLAGVLFPGSYFFTVTTACQDLGAADVSGVFSFTIPGPASLLPLSASLAFVPRRRRAFGR